MQLATCNLQLTNAENTPMIPLDMLLMCFFCRSRGHSTATRDPRRQKTIYIRKPTYIYIYISQGNLQTNVLALLWCRVPSVIK